MEGIDSQSEDIGNPPDNVVNLDHSPSNKTEVNELNQAGAEIKPAAGASTAEERCPICLEDFEDKAFIDACFHTFCFECILRWSETTITSCPMCKTGFSKIIHSVRANDDYDVFKVVPKRSHSSVSEEVVDLEEALRSFRGYRTTRFSGQSSHSQPSTSTGGGGLAESMASRSHLSMSRHVSQARRRRRDSRKPAAIEKRRAVYSTGLRALPLVRDRRPVRVRDVSAAFFLANPASTHRLYPWLNRELTMLVGEEHTQFVIQIILSLLDKVDMNSTEFASHLEPYLHEKTSHFMHEFLSFASSPYDMIAYDKNVSYDWPAGPTGPTHREGMETTDSTSVEGISVDMQQRLFDELTSTRWEDSPPIVETLSPGFVDHSSGSEIEGLQEDDKEDSQDQSATITRDQSSHELPDQTVHTEAVSEPQQNIVITEMPTSVVITDDNIERIGDTQFVDSMNDKSSSRGLETGVICEQNSERAKVSSKFVQSQTVNKIETEPESLLQPQSQSSTTTEHKLSDLLENTVPTDDKDERRHVKEDSTDYEINVYVENEEDPSNQRADEVLPRKGDTECMEKTKVKERHEEFETSSRSHAGSSVALASNSYDKIDSNKHTTSRDKQTDDYPANSKPSKTRRKRDDRKSSKRRSRRSVSTDSDHLQLSGRDVHRYKRQSREDKSKLMQSGYKRKRYRDERVWSDSDSYSCSDDDRRERHRYRWDIDRERRQTDRSHSSYRRHRSRSRGSPSNYESDKYEQCSPTMRKSKARIPNRDSRGSQRSKRSRSRSPSRSNSRYSKSRISPYYQREKGHRSKLYSDDYPDKGHRHVDDNHFEDLGTSQPHLSRTNHREGTCKKNMSKETHRKSVVKHRGSAGKGTSVQTHKCGTVKSQCELTLELSGLEEEIRDNKRDLLKSMLRRERIELLRKNLHDLGTNASVKCGFKEQQSQTYSLDCINPVEVGRKTSTSDMQKELVGLEQAIVVGKKQLLRVMMKMEEDQVEQETDDESA